MKASRPPNAGEKSNVEARQHEAIVNRVRPKTQVEGVAAAWMWLKWAGRNTAIKPSSPSLARFQAVVDDLTKAFVARVFLEWNPSLLQDLAAEMKRLKPDTWQPDRDTWFLMEAGKQGRVNLSQLAERMVELDNPPGGTPTEDEKSRRKAVALRRLRRKAHAEAVKTLDSGRPNK